MKTFLDKDFLLQTDTAKILYHETAKSLPIIDYHNHLSPKLIAEDYQFKNLTEIWLGGDHYKWRAMRANGISEDYITGNKSDEEKFSAWAKTVPYTMRNPLYHWTHLELQRYFDVHDLLDERSAQKIYETCSALLQTKEYSTRGLLRKMNVHTLCTTDDPCDSLEYHIQLKNENSDIKVLPAFRPDAAMNVDSAADFYNYVQRLQSATNKAVGNFYDYLSALKSRHDFFATIGCCVSDHGLEEIYAEDYSDKIVKASFDKIMSGQELSREENRKFKSAMLVHFAEWDFEKDWVQQYHLGAIRNNNARLINLLGADVGGDSIGDFHQAKALSKFLGNLDARGVLAKTILYNLNPADNELFATMAGNFNDGTVPGKIQYGSAWWFLDQKNGMEKQINALSNLGLLSRFVGMLTDSRSFLSFPRHEYFRRILCNLFGHDMEHGELPYDTDWMKKMVADICFNNAKNYFKL